MIADDVGTTLHTLNGMRGVAAIMVMALHFTSLRLVPAGYLAVDLFFMISGVVLASAYDERLRAGLSALHFMRLRYIRLYPVYLVGVTGGLLLGIADRPVTPAMVGLSLAMLPTLPLLPHRYLFPPINVAWSLFLELVVNFLFAALHRHLGDRQLVAIVVGAGLMTLFGTTVAGSFDFGARSPVLIFGFARAAFGFALGVLIWRQRARLTWALPAGLVLPLVAAGCVLPAFDRGVQDCVIVFLLWPLLVVAGVNARSAAPVLGWLGAISYPVYCLHIMFAGFVARAASPWVALAVGAGIVAAAAAIDRWYDRPMRALLGAPARAGVARGR